jgi:acyl-coenzyme A thioesterase PaaI-like protein
MPLVHDELCFGCGRANLFGLMLEMNDTGPGVVDGRGFIKQDHRGPDRGTAHQGIVAAALEEAMALACGLSATPLAFTVGFVGTATVGEFLELSAGIEQRTAEGVEVTASARSEGRLVARARGTYAVPDGPVTTLGG